MKKTWVKRLVVTGCLGGIPLIVGGIFYLSWIPSPRLSELGWMPRWLGEWSDKFDRLRTGIPFVVLGGLAGLLLWIFKRKAGDWGLVFLFLTCVVMTAELGQTSLTRRVVDWQDVVWGAVGTAVGMGIIKFASLQGSVFRRKEEF